MNTTIDNSTATQRRLTIRVGCRSLSFSTTDGTPVGSPVVYEPYAVKSGISMAANLREALKTAATATGTFQKVTVMVDSPVLMIPADLFRDGERDMLYRHSYPSSAADTVMHNVLPSLSAVAVFSVNKDLKTVVDDNFRNAMFICAATPVWRYLHHRSFSGNKNKLYGYFHDSRLDIFCFTQHRFKFCNAFETESMQDSLYFLLYVWKHLALNQNRDELHLVGDIPERDRLLEELRKFISRSYAINPSGDFNRAQVTQIKDMPYDLMTLYVKGR